MRARAFATCVACGVSLCGALGAAEPPFARLAADSLVRTPPPLPPIPAALHEPFTDPVFGTRIMRITDPSQVEGASRIRHYYAKQQPLNADESRAILVADGRYMLYDARSWQPLKRLKIGSPEPEIQWHPADPSHFYYLDAADGSKGVRAMFAYDIRDDSRRLLREFREYDMVRGRLEGNIDRAGRYYAMLGTTPGKEIEAFVYDIAQDKVSARLPVTEKMAGDWISVSPSGRFVVMMGERSRVYDIDMRPLWELPPKSFGHGDICLLEDGTEALVYDGADHQLNNDRNLNIANLDRRKVSVGVRIGWGTTPHVSCRNVDLPGWALVSTQGPDAKYPNHDFEIFWLKLDGSRAVRRVAHHRSSRALGGYFAEQHAVPNRRGDRIIFSSNWGGKTVNDYLIELGPSTLPPPRPR